MFRNGITIGRRPFAHSVRHDLPSFVCTACQARTLATHPHHAKNPRSTARRAHKHPEPENLMGAIKQLEKQVQLMERNYVEQLRKRAAEKVRSGVSAAGRGR